MFYNYREVKLHYQKIGNNKKTIVILPGWGETACTFQEIINILKEDYTIYLIDYPGFGKTPPLNTTWSIYQYGEMLNEFLKDLEIAPSLVIAHSFGGRLAILLDSYFHFPLSKILLIDSAGIRPRRTLRFLFRKYRYRFLKMLRFLLPAKKRQSYLAFLFEKYSSSDYYNLPSSMRLTFQQIVNEDLRKYLPLMQSEVLLLWGKEDQDTPLKDAFLMKKKIKKSELIVFERCGHFSYFENPYLTAKIILAFLDDEKEEVF